MNTKSQTPDSEALRVLILEDTPSDAELMERELRKGKIHFTSMRVETEYAFTRALTDFKPDIILSDYVLPSFDGLSALVIAQEVSPDVPFIFVTGKMGEEWAIESFKMGAIDYVLKDMMLKLVPAVKRALSIKHEQKERREAEKKTYYYNLVLSSIRKVNQLIVKEKNRKKLIQLTCDNLTETRGFYTAWIALFDKSGKLIMSAESGIGRDFSPLIERLKHGQPTECVQKSMKKKGVIVFDNISKTCKDCPLAEKHGDRSIMSIRLEHNRNIYGMMCVPVPHDVIEDKRERDLFEEIAGDIGFAFYNIELEEEQNRNEKNLSESEEKFRTISSAALDAIIMMDDEGKIKFWNEASERIFGYTKEETYGKDLHNIIVPGKYHKAFHKGFIGFKKNGKGAVIGKLLEISAIRKNGDEFPVELSLSSVKVKDKWNAIGIIRDITERKQIEEAIKKSRKKFQTLYDEAPVGYHELDLNAKIVQVNKTEAEMLGYTINEMLGKSIFDFIAPEERKAAKKNFSQIIKEKSQKGFERKYIHKNGQEIYFYIVSKLITDNEGRVIGKRSTLQNITERKHIDDALRKSEEHYRSLFENMTNGYAFCRMIFDQEHPKDFIYLDVNRAFESLTGLKNVIGEKVSEVIPGIKESDPELFEIYGRIALSGKPEKFEFYLKALNMWLTISVFSPGKKYFVAIFDVITERKIAEKKLEESEERYRTLFEKAAEGIAIADIETKKFRYVNPAICNMLGYSEEELLTMSINNIHPKEELEHVIAEFEAQARGEKTLSLLPCLRKDGKILYTNINATMAIIAGRECNIGFFTDITEQIKVENELLESEKKYRSVFENTGTATVIIEEDTIIPMANTEFEKLSGYTKEEIEGKMSWTNFVVKEDMENMKKYHIERRKGGSVPNKYEFRFIDRNKNIKDILVAVSVIPGTKISVASLIDITERKQIEKQIKDYSENLEYMVKERTMELNLALHDTEEARVKIDSILKAVGEGLIVTNRYNRIVLMNRAAEELLGVRFSEVIERPIDFAIEEKTLRERLVNTFNKKKTNYQFDFQLPGNVPAHPRVMRARTSIIFDKSGEKTGIVTIISDVTHEREIDRMKTEFISTAAHELRTPLTSIVGFSEILTTREDISEEEKKRFLSYINKQGVHLSNIVSDLLDISRIESGKGFELNKEMCNARSLIEEIIPYFQEISLKHEFEVDLPDTPLKFYGDREKCEQVLKNILSNAVKYSPMGGKIRISGEIIENNFQVSIEDHGIGMTPEQVEKVFEKFYRADTSDTAPEGTGLGMVIVKYIVESHGGKVWVESKFGKGTTVRFIIPIKLN